MSLWDVQEVGYEDYFDVQAVERKALHFSVVSMWLTIDCVGPTCDILDMTESDVEVSRRCQDDSAAYMLCIR